MDSERVQLFVNITGASEQIALEKLQAYDGNLNAAINSFYNDGEPMNPAQRGNSDGTQWMEEEQPPIGQHVADFPSHPPLNTSAWPGQLATSRGFGGLDDEASGLPPGDTFPMDARIRNSMDIPMGRRNSVETRVRPGATILESENAHLPSLSATDFVSDEDEVSGPASAMPRAQGDGLPFHRISSGTDYNFNTSPLPSPAVGHNEGAEIEEEMIQAAIEASRKETMGMPGLAFGEGHGGVDGAEGRTEDDDMAWALSQSLKTAEEEKEIRGRLLHPGSPKKPFLQENVDNSYLSSSSRTANELFRKGSPSAKDNITPTELRYPSNNVSSELSMLNSPADRTDSGYPTEEGNEVEEEPLLRRRSNRRLNPSFNPYRPEYTQPSTNQEAQHVDAYSSSSIHANGNVGDSDEWGGLSSEEQHDAVMLEAAMFGPLPRNVGSRFHYPLPGGRGVENADMFEDGGISNYPRVPQQPPSPSVIAQRLLREQQDDEYLASLEADREKEARAKLEEEMRLLKEAEAKVAAQKEHQLRQEEELRKSLAAKELERKLVIKRAMLPAEPSVDDEAGVNLMVRMPDGSRQGRRFWKSDRLQCLFDFIDVSGAVEPGSYRLVRQYPRKALTEGELDHSFQDLALSSRHELLFLELV